MNTTISTEIAAWWPTLSLTVALVLSVVNMVLHAPVGARLKATETALASAEATIKTILLNMPSPVGAAIVKTLDTTPSQAVADLKGLSL